MENCFNFFSDRKFDDKLIGKNLLFVMDRDMKNFLIRECKKPTKCDGLVINFARRLPAFCASKHG